jgi:hypothetical protein
VAAERVEDATERGVDPLQAHCRPGVPAEAGLEGEGTVVVSPQSQVAYPASMPRPIAARYSTSEGQCSKLSGS